MTFSGLSRLHCAITLGLWGLCLGVLACKPDASTETSAAGSPEQGPAPVASVDAAPPSDPKPATATATATEEIPGGQSATLAQGAIELENAEDSDVHDTAVAEQQDSGHEGDTAEAETGTHDEVVATPSKPHKVLILGDSLAATGFGALLENKLDAHPDVVCYRKGKSASGLARPDFFDWIAEGKRQVEFRKPELVIVILGGNDGQDLTRRTKGGKRVHWQKPEWPEAYRKRMDTFLAELTGPGRTVLWLGLPTMGLRSLEKKLTLIRGVQKQAVDALGKGGIYVDTVPFVTNDKGELLTHAKVGKRKKAQPIRAEDRIHFTMPGSEYFADQVYPLVLKALELSDVEAG